MSIKIIPAIDIINGNCVRLTQGNYNMSRIYNKTPLEFAKQIDNLGFEYLHLIDLDGAKSNSPQNLKILEKIASQTKLKIEFGGGIKSSTSLNDALNAGATKVIIGSIAYKDPIKFMSWLLEKQDKIILGADVRDYMISINGWKEDTKTNIYDFINMFLDKGLNHIIITDISKDGMLSGTNNNLYQDIKKKYPKLALSASGGIKDISNIKELDMLNLDYVIVGKAIYEGYISLEELSNYTSYVG